MTKTAINHDIPGTDDYRPNGNSSRNDVRNAIIDSMRGQMIKGWSKREIISFATKVMKNCGFPMYIEGMYEAIKEGSL